MPSRHAAHNKAAPGAPAGATTRTLAPRRAGACALRSFRGPATHARGPRHAALRTPPPYTPELRDGTAPLRISPSATERQRARPASPPRAASVVRVAARGLLRKARVHELAVLLHADGCAARRVDVAADDVRALRGKGRGGGGWLARRPATCAARGAPRASNTPPRRMPRRIPTTHRVHERVWVRVAVLDLDHDGGLLELVHRHRRRQRPLERPLEARDDDGQLLDAARRRRRREAADIGLAHRHAACVAGSRRSRAGRGDDTADRRAMPQPDPQPLRTRHARVNPLLVLRVDDRRSGGCCGRLRGGRAEGAAGDAGSVTCARRGGGGPSCTPRACRGGATCVA